jgi:hypothetical protein
MKRLLLSAILVSFAVAAQAGDSKTTKASNGSKETPACCAATKVSTQTKATCSEQAKACSGSSSCKDTPTKQALLSPKASGEVTKKL